MPRRSVLPLPRIVLALCAALALWLVPATVERHVAVGGVRAVATHDASSLDAARLPERIEVTAHGTLPVFARAGGTSALPVPASFAATWTRDARVHALAVTARRTPAPRRLAFPVEATAPPVALS